MADSDREIVRTGYEVFIFDMNMVTSTEVTHTLGVNPLEVVYPDSSTGSSSVFLQS